VNEPESRRRPWGLILVMTVIVIAAPILIHFGPILWSSAPLETTSDGTAGETAAVVCHGHVDIEDGVTALNPVQPGRVVEVAVHEGQVVKAGTVLLRLDDEQARLVVRQAEGELKAAQARLAQARKLPEQQRADLAAQQAAIEAARYRLAAGRQNLQRTRRLRKENMAGSEEAGVAEDQVKELEAALQAEEGKRARLLTVNPAEQVALAEAETDARQARLEEARHALAERTVRAPMDGEVLRLLVAVGDVASPQARQSALLFCPDRPRVVRAEVPQEFADRVSVSQPVRIQDDARLVDVGRGQVARLSNWFTQRRSVLQEPTVRNDVRTLECIVRVDPGQPPLRIGQRVRVLIGDLSGRGQADIRASNKDQR
jgi:multidrug resistance efflux pump